MKVKIIIREHAGYKEFIRAEAEAKKRKNKLPIKQYFGQFQYLFYANRRLISVVQLWDIFDNRWFWEIAVFRRNGQIKSDSIERFPTFEKAQERVWETLS